MAEFKAITTQDEFDTAISARLKRERETIEKKYEGWKSPETVADEYKNHMTPEQAAEKYKGWLSPEKAAEKDAKIKGYETTSVKMRIAHETGIPFELVDRLTGDDEAAIRKDAELLSGFIKQTSAKEPLADPESGAGGDKDAAYKSLAAAMTKGE